MDKDIAKDKNIKKKKKPKTKTKAKTKVKPRQTQTQSQKVIVNLQDVKRRRTKTRRTRATPQQPQVIYQQAPIPPQQDLNSIVRDQLSRLVPQQAPLPVPLPVEQAVPQVVLNSSVERPVAERRVEQIEKPELVKTEMPKSIKGFNFTPDDPVLGGGQTKKLSKEDKRLRKESNREGMEQADIESTAFRSILKPVGIPTDPGPIKPPSLAAEEPSQSEESNREGMAQADIESTAFRSTLKPVGIPTDPGPIKPPSLAAEEPVQLVAPQKGVATAKPSQKGKGKGVPKSEETKAKMAAAKKGTTLPPETKAKMAKSQTGQVKSKETKAKTAASLEAYNVERKAGTFV